MLVLVSALLSRSKVAANLKYINGIIPLSCSSQTLNSEEGTYIVNASSNANNELNTGTLNLQKSNDSTNDNANIGSTGSFYNQNKSDIVNMYPIS